MGLLENLIITAVIESTAGTLQADAGDGSDALKFTKDTKAPSTGLTFIENPEYTGSRSPSAGFVGPKEGGFDIGMLIRGSGYYDVAPPMGILLKACGFREEIGTGGTVSAAPAPSTTEFTVTGSDLEKDDIILVQIASAYEATKVTDATGEAITVSPALSQAPSTGANVYGQPTYKPTSDDTLMESLSMYHYMDGVKIAQHGCRGNVKFDFKWGEMAIANFTMTPLGWTPSTADYGATPDFSSLQSGLPVMGGVFNLGTTETYIESLSLDMGTNISALGAIQKSEFYENFVGANAAKGTFDPFASTAQELIDFAAGTSGSIWFELGSSNNRFVMSMPSIKRESVDFADREGINTYNTGFGAYGVQGNDEVVFAFCSETASS